MVLRNTIYQFLSRFLSSAFSLAVAYFLIKSLGIEIYAQFGLIIAIYAIFLSISDFGVNTSSLKLFSEESYLTENFSRFLGYRILLSVFAIILLGVSLFWLRYPSELTFGFVVIAILILLNALLRGFLLIVQVHSNYKDYLVSSVVSYSIGISLLFLLYFQGILSINSIWLLYLSVNLILVMILGYKKRKYLYSQVYFDFEYYKFLLKDSWIIGVTLLLNLVMINFDRILLSKLSTLSDLGNYSLAYRFFEIFLLLPTYMMNVYFPRLLQSLNDDQLIADTRKLITKFTYIGFLSGIIMYFSSFIIVPIWGYQSAAASDAVRYLSFGLVIFFITAPLSLVLSSTKHRITLLYAYLIGLVVNILFNILFIPSMGYHAAIIATYLSELIVLIILAYVFVKYDKSRHDP